LAEQIFHLNLSAALRWGVPGAQAADDPGWAMTDEKVAPFNSGGANRTSEERT
jgi:hypothetical protein